MKRQQRGESRPTVIGAAAENAEPSVRVEWHLTEGRHVSGVEPHLRGLDRASPPPPRGPFAVFRCVPRLSLTRRRAQTCHFNAAAQTPGRLCDRPSRVTLIT